jgi:hypothetical protein
MLIGKNTDSGRLQYGYRADWDVFVGASFMPGADIGDSKVMAVRYRAEYGFFDVFKKEFARRLNPSAPAVQLVHGELHLSGKDLAVQGNRSR